MADCPTCGADRLKGAPLALVSLVAQPLTGRRRYRCGACSWTGWKHRLRRAGRPGTAIGAHEDTAPRAAWFFVLAVMALVSFAALAVRSCPSLERPPSAAPAEIR